MPIPSVRTCWYPEVFDVEDAHLLAALNPHVNFFPTHLHLTKRGASGEPDVQLAVVTHGSRSLLILANCSLPALLEQQDCPPHFPSSHLFGNFGKGNLELPANIIPRLVKLWLKQSPSLVKAVPSDWGTAFTIWGGLV